MEEKYSLEHMKHRTGWQECTQGMEREVTGVVPVVCVGELGWRL